MSIREIPSSDWERFLIEFSRGHRAWLATVERVRDGLTTAADTRGGALDRVRLDPSRGGRPRIAIEFQGDSGHTAAVQIDEAIRLRVDETDDGRARGLEIEDARGEWTQLRFRTAPPVEALDGIAPGEL